MSNLVIHTSRDHGRKVRGHITWWHHLLTEHGYVPQQLQGRSVARLREIHAHAHKLSGIPTDNLDIKWEAL